MGRIVFNLAFAAALFLWDVGTAPAKQTWSAEEVRILRSLWIGNLPRLSKDPSNAVGSNPKAAKMGHRIFSTKGSAATAPSPVPPATNRIDALPMEFRSPRGWGRQPATPRPSSARPIAPGSSGTDAPIANGPRR